MGGIQGEKEVSAAQKCTRHSARPPAPANRHIPKLPLSGAGNGLAAGSFLFTSARHIAAAGELPSAAARYEQRTSRQIIKQTLSKIRSGPVFYFNM